MKDQPDTLRNNPIWKETYSLVEYMYDKQEEITAKFPDERWTTASKIRNIANDAMFYVSLATGSSSAYATEFDWNSARKYLFALQTEYIFAGEQKFFELEPAITKRIDDLLKEIDRQMAAAKKASKEKDREDLEPWLAKHKLWKEMRDR